VLEVRLNDERVQYSSLDAMVFKFAELISDISHCMTLEPGDLIMTGTPEGIGPVKSGDRLELSISGPVRLSLMVNCR
ncbi:MAG: fumarylacetoacetate hydrolase family protein, partial [Candidatus Riflebacteria bacterium]